MKPISAVIACVASLISMIAANAISAPISTRMLYSVSVNAKGVLRLSVYNPADEAACIPFTEWPGPSNVLRVVGDDGREWDYIGLEAETVGRARDLRIEPHTEYSTMLDILGSYRPVSGASKKLGKVFYGAVFEHC